MKTPQPECPECEKLSAVAKKSNEIGEFLDYFLGSKNIVLAQWVENEDFDTNSYMPDILLPCQEYRGQNGINKLLAEYFGIDLNKVEQERMELLEWLRSERE